MKFNYIDDGINAVVVDDTYNEEQARLIKKELVYFNEPHKMWDPDETSSAYDTSGKMMKKNKGIFLDFVYKDSRYSDIITSAISVWRNKEVVSNLMEFNSLFKMVKYFRGMSSLISYYENSDYYKAHQDNAAFTVVTYFFNEPKKFSGGDIILYSDNYEKKAVVEVMNNRSIIFPSCTAHEVTPIVMQPDAKKGDGRYCISHFIFTSPDQNRKIES